MKYNEFEYSADKDNISSAEINWYALKKLFVVNYYVISY